jgi:hypothetical protein
VTAEIEKRRAEWRRRQQSKRLADALGLIVIPVRAMPDQLHAQLCAGGYLCDRDDKHPSTLARGVEALLRDMRSVTARDIADMTSSQPRLRWHEGQWTFED